MPAVIEAVRVRKTFPDPNGAGVRTAVADLSFQVDAGEVVCIVGKTGCGKSTLVNMLLGLEPPTSGQLTVNGMSPSGDFMAMRRSVAAVFQTDRLLPWRLVIDNAALGLEAANVGRTERRAAARPWLARVGLEQWENHFPYQLSGGMRQRVSIARAFVLDPAVILLDEAFGHLDEVTAQQVRQDCLGLIRETGKAAVVITHNISEALDIGSRILVLGRPARILCEFDLTERRRAATWDAERSRLRDDIFAAIERSEH
jgi:NitT/TauT family transport system ATP-binding protein